MKKDLKNLKYKLACCGGTFDNLHKGHEDFLSFALEKSEKLVIGITSDKFAKERLKKNIESYNRRRQHLISFLKRKGVMDKVSLSKIDQVFGEILIKDNTFNAIFVTDETFWGAEVINKKRAKKKLRSLDIVIVPKSVSKDQIVISSSRIRKGEINRQGELLFEKKWKSRTLILPVPLRKKLKKPFGKIIQENSLKHQEFQGREIITVGDVVTKTFLSAGIKPNLAIVDLHVARKRKFKNIKEHGFSGNEIVVRIENKAGTLNPLLWRAIEDSLGRIRKKEVRIILIDGEEDLCVLPAILLAPVSAHIYYGQPARNASHREAGGPNKGIVEVESNLKNKEKAHKILSNFEEKSEA